MKIINVLKSVLVFILVTALYFIIFLPALNFQSMSFVMYFIIIVSILVMVNLIDFKQSDPKKLLAPVKKYLIAIGIVFLIMFIGFMVYSPTFNSKAYATRITITNSDFKADIDEVDLGNLPLLDRNSTEKVGDRVMGQIPELISQFKVSDLYSQVNYSGRLVRVTPLEYDGFIKWLSNPDGSVGYIKVDSTTGAADLIKLDEGMKYLPSAYIFKNLKFHLRMQYPTAIFDNSKFEIDDEGNPYWITPVMKYKWIGVLEDVKGVVVTDPVSGESNYYDNQDIPAWVDHVYPSSLVLDQVNDWGLYQGGFFNSFLSQKDVRKTTSGYTYLADESDIFVYTGITSALADESNIGFVLVNLRTKECMYYPVAGAEEFSAMASAEGAIQEKNYISTFPLLINLNKEPTYLVSLKDGAGLVKAYAFIDVVDYQKVRVTDSSAGLQTAASNYLAMLGVEDTQVKKGEQKTGVIDDIQEVVIDGNSYYYLKLVNDQEIYKALVSVNDGLPFFKIGDTISFTYNGDQINFVK